MSGAGADVSVYRRIFPEWCMAVFCYSHGWDVQPPSADIPDGILDHLQNLAGAMRLYVPVLQPNGLDSIRDYAQRVKDALQEDTSIPRQLRIHAHEVIEHLLWCDPQRSVRASCRHSRPRCVEQRRKAPGYVALVVHHSLPMAVHGEHDRGDTGPGTRPTRPRTGQLRTEPPALNRDGDAGGSAWGPGG
jgi:hypothetical protein